MDSPSPELIKSTRKGLGLTQTQAAAVICKKWRLWQRCESGEREMDPCLWDYFLIKTKEEEKTKPS